MAIVFPAVMPTRGAAGQQFEPDRLDFSSPTAGGELGGVQAGAPRWLATWTLGKMGQLSSDVWRAWASSMRGSQRRFFGFDLARPFPLSAIAGFAHMTRVGGAAFDGSATSWSAALDSSENELVTLNGLPAGLVLSLMDYIGFKWDAAGDTAGTYRRRALVRVVQAGVASGTGSVTVTCEPPVPAVVPSDAVAHLDNPCCVMGLITNTNNTVSNGTSTQATALGPIDRSLAVTSGVIAAVEDLRA